MFDFKSLLREDLDIFIDPDMFGDEHLVEGKNTVIVIDDDRLTELKAGADIGIAESSLLFYAKVTDLPKRKEPGETLNVNGKLYIVDKWIENVGIAEVIIGQHRTA